MHIKEFKLSFLITVEGNLYSSVFSPPWFTVMCMEWLAFPQPQWMNRRAGCQCFLVTGQVRTRGLDGSCSASTQQGGREICVLNPAAYDKIRRWLSSLTCSCWHRNPPPPPPKKNPSRSSGGCSSLWGFVLSFQLRLWKCGRFRRLTRWHSFTAHVEISLSGCRRSDDNNWAARFSRKLISHGPH